MRVDLYTARDWVERGRLLPDRSAQQGRREIFFFRRDRLEQIRQQLLAAAAPQTGAEWRQEFLDFVGSRDMNKSYKPVMLAAMLGLVSRDGEVRLDDLAVAFQQFYVQRQRAGLPVEFGAPALERPAEIEAEAIKRLIVKNPLERFIIKGFLSYDAAAGLIRFAPQLWAELRFYELLDIQRSLAEQIRYYYARRMRKDEG